MSETTQKTERRVRAVILDASRRKALIQFNNRVIPNHVCLMLPGGGIDPGERPLEALARELLEELGVTISLDAGNCRFLLSRTVEFPEPDGKKFVELGFFVVDVGGAVPRNMEPESVLSVEWLTLQEVERWLSSPREKNYHIQIGALDALKAALDPARTGAIPGGFGRVVARAEAPMDPRPPRPARQALPTGAPVPTEA